MRWPTRQVQASIALHVKTALDDLGWFADVPTLTEYPVRWDADFDPEGMVSGGGPTGENLIGLSLGDTPDNVAQEMGGGLLAVNVPVFIDVYGEKRGVALNLSDDIQGVLQGELWTPSRYIPLYDHSQDPPVLVTDRALEARMVEAAWPSGGSGVAVAEWRRRWRVVRFTATSYFNSAGAGS